MTTVIACQYKRHNMLSKKNYFYLHPGSLGFNNEIRAVTVNSENCDSVKCKLIRCKSINFNINHQAQEPGLSLRLLETAVADSFQLPFL